MSKEREREGDETRGGEEVKHLAKWTLIHSSLIKEKPGNRSFCQLDRGTHRHSICPSEPLDILANIPNIPNIPAHCCVEVDWIVIGGHAQSP